MDGNRISFTYLAIGLCNLARRQFVHAFCHTTQGVTEKTPGWERLAYRYDCPRGVPPSRRTVEPAA